MTSRNFAVVFRFVLATASIAAMSFQLFAIHIPSGYSVVNFFTYFTNLSNLDPIVNVILHYVLPIAAVIDWLIWPPKNRLPFRVIWWWMIFPAVCAAFAIIRAALTGICPYQFFNPDASGCYGGVAVLCWIMLVGFFVLALAVRAIGVVAVRVPNRLWCTAVRHPRPGSFHHIPIYSRVAIELDAPAQQSCAWASVEHIDEGAKADRRREYLQLGFCLCLG